MGYRPDLRAVMLLAVGRWADSSRCGTTCAVPPTGRPGVPTRIRSSRSGPSPALDTHSLVEGPDPMPGQPGVTAPPALTNRALHPSEALGVGCPGPTSTVGPGLASTSGDSAKDQLAIVRHRQRRDSAVSERIMKSQAGNP